MRSSIMINHFKPARDVVVVVAIPSKCKPHRHTALTVLWTNDTKKSFLPHRIISPNCDRLLPIIHKMIGTLHSSKKVPPFALYATFWWAGGWEGWAEEKQSNPPMSDDKANFCHHVINWKYLSLDIKPLLWVFQSSQFNYFVCQVRTTAHWLNTQKNSCWHEGKSAYLPLSSYSLPHSQRCSQKYRSVPIIV